MAPRTDIDASSHRALTDIRVPFLAINAADDPIVGYSPGEEANNSISCALFVTQHGGHLGWFQGGSPVGFSPPPDRWIRKPALEWLRVCAEDYIPENEDLLFGDNDCFVRDGFVVDKVKKNVGFKVVEEGIVFDGTKPAGGLSAGL